MYIYDGLHRVCISNNSKLIIHIRYPNAKIEFVLPATLQPDYCACGVFAAAYATAIILGGCPATQELALTRTREPSNRDPTTDLRYHLADIITNERLECFPSP